MFLGVLVMKLVKTFGRGKATADALIKMLERRGAVSTARVEPVVRRILAEVRKRGDRALLQYAAKLDGLTKGHALLVSRDEMKAAWEETTPKLQAAMMVARGNILTFAEAQMPQEWTISPSAGVKTGQIVRPLGSVGCYVPGGRYPLPSTLLMTVTPAQVAGVERIVVCSPKPAKETMAAAWLAGVTEFYRVGGAQAIAAMAYGTDTIAADLVAQAEHDPEALAVLITSNETLAREVAAEVNRQVRGNAIAKRSLAAQGCIFVTATVRDAQDLTNRLAPEHLTVDAASDLKWVRNAGSVFVGRYSPQSMGDYISGPNHVLPTGRVGRVRGGLSVIDFVKVITVQEYTYKGLKQMGPHAIALAEAEGLTGHAESVRMRMK
jgi:histidinol dehydrogenase